MELTILTADKADQLTAIFVELEEYYFAEQAASPAEIQQYLRNFLFSPDSGVRVIAAYLDGIVMGFATYSIMYPAPKLSGQMYMKDLFVSQRARGYGVGRRIMQFLAAYALEKGCTRLDWTAEATNPKAGEFYHSIGANLVSEKQYYRFSEEKLRQFALQ